MSKRHAHVHYERKLLKRTFLNKQTKKKEVFISCSLVGLSACLYGSHLYGCKRPFYVVLTSCMCSFINIIIIVFIIIIIIIMVVFRDQLSVEKNIKETVVG